MEIQDKKLQRQLLGVDKWKRAKELGLSHSNCWGAWTWFTGVGKTYGTFLIAKGMFEKNDAYYYGSWP